MLSTTPQERLALGVTVLLLAGGAGVRVFSPAPPPAEWQVSAAGDDTSSEGTLRVLTGEAERAAAREREARRPLAPGERLDPNRATAAQLQRLPRVGPALAARIVAHREEHGPFRSLADLDAVSGVGPALLEAVAPHLALPAAAPATARPGPPGRVDLNRATAAELDALPGVGPALAERIVAHRAAHGPFRSPADLEAVPGIGPRLVARLAPLVAAGP